MAVKGHALIRKWGALLWLAMPALVQGQPAPSAAPALPTAPETRMFRYSAYEQATIDGALTELGFTRDDRPEGKKVESIHAVRLEVIEVRDPAPRFLNWFHVLTRSRVIEREVLLRPNDPYRQALADETQRNLSGLPQLSLVLVVATQGSAPDEVRLVVITKDVWSLRLSWDMALAGGGLERLAIDLSETNFLGTHQTAGLQFDWLPQSYSLGARYVMPRISGTHVNGSADAGLIFNGPTGAREGSYGDLTIGQPLWSSLTEWAWSAGLTWRDELTRHYIGRYVAAFVLAPGTNCDQTPNPCVPYVYRSDVLNASASVTRSFGWAVKHDFTFGFAARRNRYALPDLAGYDPATVRAFAATSVPVSDDRVGPSLQYETYSTSYLRILDLETLALQEDYRLGHDAYLRLYPVLTALGSSRNFVGMAAGAFYTLGIRDGLLRAGVESVTEIETGSGQVKDGSIRGTFRFASPRLLIGRVVVDGVLLDRYANYLNRLTYLGGDSRLRGYPSQLFGGSDFLAVNVEYRSQPLELFHSVQVAGTLFYDAGDAFDAWSELHVWQSVGFGARILFPQLNRTVFRVDVGFPLERPAALGSSPVAFFAAFGQAF